MNDSEPHALLREIYPIRFLPILKFVFCVDETSGCHTDPKRHQILL
jgi:hypothetical protein